MNMIQRLLRAMLQFNHQARLFLLVIGGLGFAIDGVYAVLLNLYLLRLDYGTDFIGLVNAIGLLTFAVTSLPAGLMGARWSNTRMLKIGVVVITLGGILLPFAEFVPLTMREVWLVVTYATMLCGFSIFFVNGEPYLINAVDTTRRNVAFAVKTAMLSLAAFVGSLIGGAVPEILAGLSELSLDNPEPYRLTLTIVSFVLVASVFIVISLETPSEEEFEDTTTAYDPVTNLRVVPKWTVNVIVLIGVMTFVRLLQVAGAATVTVYFNVYLDTQLQVSTGLIGLITAIARLVGVPAALMVPSLIQRWGKVNVIVYGSMLTATFLLPIALFENWVIAALSYICALSMTSIRYTAFVVYILELVPRVQQSIMSGSGEMAGGLSFSMMALGGGIILSLFTFRDLFLVGSMLSFTGTFLFWLHWRFSVRKRKIKPALSA